MEGRIDCDADYLFFQFSSLTSNVVMLRAAQGYHWDKSRFW